MVDDKLQNNPDPSLEDIKSQFKLAQSLLEKDDKKLQEEGFRCFQEIAQLNDVGPEGLSTLAKFNLGVCYEHGLGVKKSLKTAQEYYLEAAQLGLEQGYSHAKNCEKAISCLDRIHSLCFSNTNVDPFKFLEDDDFTWDELLGQEKEGNKEQSSELDINHYKQSADLGDIEAQEILGNCYLSGNGVEKSQESAFRYYKMAAEQGSAEGQYNVGLLYESGGDGVPQSHEEAFRYYKMAADKGHANAQLVTGYGFAKGLGTIQSDEGAIHYYQLAADQNIPGSSSASTQAKYNLGIRYDNGQGVEKSEKEAFRYYKMAADQGHADAQLTTGYRFAKELGTIQSYEQAIYYYQLAADQNISGPSSASTQAKYNLGIRYDNGQGVEKSKEEAFRYYKMAADEGHADAQQTTGYRFSQGLGIAQSNEKAIHYYQLAADQNIPGSESASTLAKYNLGIHYNTGEGVERSLEMSFRYYKMATDEGYLPAYCTLGDMYLFGLGTKQSHSEAMKYYIMIVDKDIKGRPRSSIHTRLQLEHFPLNGLGIEKSKEEIFECYKKAANEGNVIAQFNLAIFYTLGMKVKKSTSDAIHYLQLVANQNIPGAFSVSTKAKARLGEHYKRGIGVEKSIDKAFSYYKAAAEEGYPPAQFNLANMYSFHEGVKKSYSEAIRYYKLVINLQSENMNEVRVLAMHNLGNCFEVQEDYNSSAYYYELAAEQGYAKAELKMAKKYFFGQGVSQSYEKSWHYCQRLIEKNIQGTESPSTHIKAFIHEYKKYFSVFISEKEMDRYLESAANQQNKEACYLFAQELEKRSDNVDPEKIYQYYLQASTTTNNTPNLASNFAKYKLGECYERGFGIDQSNEKAFQYFKISADEGHPLASYKTGEYFEKGMGVQQSYEMACKYYLLSETAEGYLKAANCYQQMGEGFIEERNDCLRLYKELSS